MQKLPSFNNSKRKNSGDGLAKFERAQKLFQDIESILEQEIASAPVMAATYENIAKIKRSKRKRPGLIRNFSTKTRQVINDMEYDPVTNTWLGNYDALSIFSPLQPALIANRGRHDKEKVVGKMVWDPVEQKWKGNEKDARKFPRKPALITSRNVNYLQKEEKGMVFDPVTMRWIGNDADVDIFVDFEKLDDGGVAVGNEFQLPTALAKSFVECANRHKSSLSGWFAGPLDTKTHLYAIRNMSILRIVRDIKQRTTYVDSDEVDANVPERDVPHKDAINNSGNGNNSVDPAEDYDDLPFTGPAKFQLRDSPEDDWGNDFDMDDSSPFASCSTSDDKGGEKPTGSQIAESKSNSKHSEEDDWDNDFENTEALGKLKIPPPTLRKPFQMEPAKRGSVIDLSFVRKAAAPVASKPPVEEEEDGLDLPPGPIRLQPTKPVFEGGELEELGDNLEVEAASVQNDTNDDEKQDDNEEQEEEDVEDWSDVLIPSDFPSLVVKRVDNGPEKWDYDKDLDIPANDALVLKKAAKSSDEEDGFADSDEDLLDGLEIPDNFDARLKR